jgi:hypothetical protein
MLAAAIAGACSDPLGFDPEPPAEEEVCAASREWLPDTPAVDLYKPLPHPSGECPFYRDAWQNFLIAAQPDAGQPAFLAYPTVDTAFDPAVPHAPGRSVLGDVRQAGGRQILIDQHGNAIYYGIHVNQAYADFIDESGLRTADAIRDADPGLFFPAGVVEFKSAWQIIEPAESADDYITASTTVPTLSMNADHRIVEDRATARQVQVKLLALHVVFTLPGHPEFVWATFEHSDGTPDTQASDGHRDVAPVAAGNPDPSDPNNLEVTDVVSPDDHLLYLGGTPTNEGNRPINDRDLVFDAASQKFTGQATSVYRMFPASKSNTIDADEAISSLNRNVEALFAQATGLDASDRRGHYRLVGAVWMDKPEFFDVDESLENDESSPFFDQEGFVEDITANGSDSDLSILAGEDRLSSTAMESFTQAPDSFPNCFSCHNTHAVTAQGVPLDHDQAGVKLMDPKMLNVSHVLSQFLLEEMTP